MLCCVFRLEQSGRILSCKAFETACELKPSSTLATAVPVSKLPNLALSQMLKCAQALPDSVSWTRLACNACVLQVSCRRQHATDLPDRLGQFLSGKSNGCCQHGSMLLKLSHKYPVLTFSEQPLARLELIERQVLRHVSASADVVSLPEHAARPELDQQSSDAQMYAVLIL